MFSSRAQKAYRIQFTMESLFMLLNTIIYSTYLGLRTLETQDLILYSWYSIGIVHAITTAEDQDRGSEVW